MVAKKQEDQTPVLTEFIVGKTSLASDGYAELKITREGAVERVRLPIKSVGILEYQEEMKKDAPVPPVKLISIKPGSEYEKMGMKPGDIVKVYDVTNEEYQTLYTKFNEDFIWKTVLKALRTKFVDQDGKEIVGFEEKKKAFIGSGFTGHHLDQLYLAIIRLTSDREELASFLFDKR